MQKLAEAKKAVVGALGLLAIALAGVLQAGNVLPQQYVPYAQAVLSVLTVFGIYRAENAVKAGNPGNDGEGI